MTTPATHRSGASANPERRGVRTVVTANHRCQVDSGKRVVSRDLQLCKEFRRVISMNNRPVSPTNRQIQGGSLSSLERQACAMYAPAAPPRSIATRRIGGT
jgi:ribosomal protein S14